MSLSRNILLCTYDRKVTSKSAGSAGGRYDLTGRRRPRGRRAIVRAGAGACAGSLDAPSACHVRDLEGSSRRQRCCSPGP
eukprot:6948797-Prymnesium_polylepis.1